MRTHHRTPLPPDRSAVIIDTLRQHSRSSAIALEDDATPTTLQEQLVSRATLFRGPLT